MRKYVAVLAVFGALASAGVATGTVDSLMSPSGESQLQNRAAVFAHAIAQARSGASISTRGRRGPRGPRGPRGAKGATGATGAFSSIVTATGPTATMCSFEASCAIGSSVANCPAGTHVIGGGWNGLSKPPILATVGYNEPLGDTAWEVIMANNEGPTSTFAAVARCTS